MRRVIFSLTLLALGMPWTAVAEDAATPTEEAGAARDHKSQLADFGARLDAMEALLAVVGSKVSLLNDVVLGERVARGRTIIVHKNEMGNSFVLERVQYSLDGEVMFVKDDPSGRFNEEKEVVIFDGALTPGGHEIALSMTYGGSTYGVFTYLKGYKFKVDSKYAFNATEGKLTKLFVVSHVKPDITKDTKEKIGVRYDVEVGSVEAPRVMPEPGEKPIDGPEQPPPPEPGAAK